VATNVDLVLQQTLLAATVSIWPLSSSAAEDSNAAKEDGSLASSSTKCYTQVAEARKASTSASTSVM
jgi:hypothetical protein